MHFDLPDVTPDARPDFTDSAGCSAWLQELPLINVAPAHGRLLLQLTELNRCALPAAERARVAELLRDAVVFVQAEQAKKFAGRAVPLPKAERHVFESVVALWDALRISWLRCLAESPGRAAAALACQRALWCVGRRMAEHHKAYREIPAQDWNLLHALYAHAEEHDYADDDVPHPVHKGKAETHCMETYAQAALMEASRPSEHSPRQMALTERWLERWGRKVAIGREPPAGAPAVLCVDLDGHAGPVAPPAAGANLRHLDTQEIGKSVRKRVALLRRGETPAALGLGDDVATDAAESLLIMLYRQWCEPRPMPVPQRKSVSGTAQVTASIGAVHYYATGRQFRQPGDSRELSKSERDEIATFGRVSGRHEERYSQIHGFALETWQIKDESVTGLRLERLDVAATARYQLNQLVGVRPADAKSFLLGTLRWLSLSPALTLHAGVRMLPGLPHPVAVRPTGINARSEKYVPALLLEAVPALQSPESLVLPVGWYTPKRVIEVHHDKGAANVMLAALLERGVDYDRVSFAPAA